MEKTEIVVGEDYAYLAPGVPTPHEPLRAVVNAEPEGGYVSVTLYHPDTGQSEERVKTRELVGRWGDEPEARYGQYHNRIDAAHERNQKFTWADISDERYELVKRQRALADDLTTLGISRSKRPYAGKGGTSFRPHDADLQLNYDELGLLVELAIAAKRSGVASNVIPAWGVTPPSDYVPPPDIEAEAAS